MDPQSFVDTAARYKEALTEVRKELAAVQMENAQLKKARKEAEEEREAMEEMVLETEGATPKVAG